MNKRINILGTEYEALYKEVKEDEKLKQCDGYCDFYTKKIVVAKQEEHVMNVGDIEKFLKKVLKHEIVHAYMFESGLDCCSDFARNETLVDWIAIQIEKIHRTLSEV